MNDILKTLIDTLKSTAKSKTSAYDTEAEVRRVEGNTAWVHIPGGVDETPVKLTIACEVGDNVQVRVSGGRAFLVGNATAPPTDDTTAVYASRTAVSAQNSADDAQTYAKFAQRTADDAASAAADAQTAIINAESEISTTAENILLRVEEEYATKTETSELREEFETQMNITADDVEFKFTTLQSEAEAINDTITANQQLLEEYIRFQGALIELGKTGNSFVAKLSNEKLAFLQDDIEIAYISNNKLYITDAEIRYKLTIGNPTNGYFDFIPRANGNLSLKWRAS